MGRVEPEPPCPGLTRCGIKRVWPRAVGWNPNTVLPPNASVEDGSRTVWANADLPLRTCVFGSGFGEIAAPGVSRAQLPYPIMSFIQNPSSGVLSSWVPGPLLSGDGHSLQCDQRHCRADVQVARLCRQPDHRRHRQHRDCLVVEAAVGGVPRHVPDEEIFSSLSHGGAVRRCSSLPSRDESRRTRILSKSPSPSSGCWPSPPPRRTSAPTVSI